jgi:hypothetical protein
MARYGQTCVLNIEQTAFPRAPRLKLRLCLCTAAINCERNVMSIGTILLIILILILIGVFPTWGHSRSWGYAPSGVTGLIIVVLLILLLTGRI